MSEVQERVEDQAEMKNQAAVKEERGPRSTGNWLRRPGRRLRRAPTVILAYHRVNEPAEDPYHLCVRPEHFAEQLSTLAQRAEVVTLDQLLEPAETARAVVTFDDGYADNLTKALPVAQELGVPLTVYVTSGLVGSPLGFWWDRLARLVRHGAPHPVRLQARVGEEEVSFTVGNPRTAGRTTDALRSRLLPLPVEEIDRFLGDLAATLATHSASPADARTLDAEELIRLGRHDLVTVGAHTTDHRRLKGLPLDEQVELIRASKVALEAALGREVRHFAYPYGGDDSFDETSVEAVARCGFATAVTTLPGSAHVAEGPLTLRRRMVMDWSGIRFRAQMTRWGLL